MPNYTHVGKLKNGRHTVVTLNRVFEAGEDVPLTEAETEIFAHKFTNVRVVDAPDLAAAEKTAKGKSGK